MQGVRTSVKGMPESRLAKDSEEARSCSRFYIQVVVPPDKCDGEIG